jgi:hypothetical protein
MVPNSHVGEKIAFLINGVGQTRYPYGEDWHKIPLSLYKNQLKLKTLTQDLKLLEENKEETLQYLALAMSFCKGL